MERAGTKDTFAELGTYDDPLEHYRLGVSQIIEAARKAIARK